MSGGKERVGVGDSLFRSQFISLKTHFKKLKYRSVKNGAVMSLRN